MMQLQVSRIFSNRIVRCLNRTSLGIPPDGYPTLRNFFGPAYFLEDLVQRKVSLLTIDGLDTSIIHRVTVEGMNQVIHPGYR